MANRGSVAQYYNRNQNSKSSSSAMPLNIGSQYYKHDEDAMNVAIPMASAKFICKLPQSYKVLPVHTLRPVMLTIGCTNGLLDTVFTGYMTGHCYTDSTKSTPIVGQAVVLFCKTTMLVVGVAFTDSNGFYEFDNLDASMEYFAFMLDASNTYNAARYDNISPGTH